MFHAVNERAFARSLEIDPRTTFYIYIGMLFGDQGAIVRNAAVRKPWRCKIVIQI